MKIAGAQVQSVKGNIEANIEKHVTFCRLAAEQGADAVFFPELSLTGYEPTLAKHLATTAEDERLSIFQSLSNAENIVIGVGLPLQRGTGIVIGMVVFEPGSTRQVYAKQYLHDDELPYFVAAKGQVYITIGEKKIAPAICYESLLLLHAEAACGEGIDLYVACVAKGKKGVRKAFDHYPFIAGKYKVPVMVVNCVGACDDFVSAGSSGAWNGEGRLVGKLGEEEEGLFVFDVGGEAV